ncbi:MAG: ABC transporter permease [Clostridium sp.]|nr:ABC transporter permease [Clostridium sp.]
MRFPDLLIMSINNLRRRKLRTVLTVLGVIIGTASIVVMVSLGIGLDQMFMEQLSSWGSLTTIDVSASGGGYYGGGSVAVSAGGSGSKSSDPVYITDEVMEKFGKLAHVTGISPILDVNVIMRQGAYEAQYMNIRGVSQTYLEQLSLGEGRIPESGEMGLVFGNTVRQDFYNSKTGRGYWDTGELPDVDFLGKPLFVVFDMDAYYQSQSGSSGGDTGEGQSSVKPPKKYMINGLGVLEGGPEDWGPNSYSVYTDVDGLKAQLKKVFKKGTVIPGQPTNKKGKALNYITYNRAQIYVDEVDNVPAVQSMVADMGFQVSSQMDWMESTKQQSNMIQAVLGGIGAVSLFVAAIGIANTMMMSIYERTKEIGVMKVLGCDMGNIRNMFLIESGVIGFMGGLIGIGLSYSISSVINRFVNMEEMNGLAGNLSRIPPWLALAAVAFAILVGMAAGFMPAMRAMKLSPLAAIRNE